MAFGKKKRPESVEQPPAAQSKKPIKVTEVFTPSVPASRGFVGRKTEMKDLANMGLRVPGTQIVVWGESGAGKSSLINRALIEEDQTAVKTACTPDSTYEQILAAAFAGTGAFYITENTEQTDVNFSIGGTVGSELIGAKATSEVGMNSAKGIKREPIARPQLSPQRLVSELGARGFSWVIEDFHKVPEDERSKIAHALKVFSDEGANYPTTRVIVLGVSESVDELVHESTNVGQRLIDVPVPPLGHDELGKILDVGEGLLNLDFSAVRSWLLDTAAGTASITHALALACCNERDVVQASDETVVFTEKDFQEAAQSYVRTRSNTVKARFSLALKVHRKRTYRNTEIILRALTQLPVDGGTVGDILTVVRAEHPKYPSGNATKYLRELQEEERGSLIRKTASGVFRFDEPLHRAYAKSIFGLTTTPTAGKTALSSSEWESAVQRLFVSWESIRQELAPDFEITADDEPTEEWELEEAESGE